MSNDPLRYKGRFFESHGYRIPCEVTYGTAESTVSVGSLELALVGDDRPAPNGDEFETEMIRLMML